MNNYTNKAAGRHPQQQAHVILNDDAVIVFR